MCVFPWVMGERWVAARAVQQTIRLWVSIASPGMYAFPQVLANSVGVGRRFRLTDVTLLEVPALAEFSSVGDLQMLASRLQIARIYVYMYVYMCIHIHTYMHAYILHMFGSSGRNSIVIHNTSNPHGIACMQAKWASATKRKKTP